MRHERFTIDLWRLRSYVIVRGIYGRCEMAMAPSADAQKNFGRYREQALAEPVVVIQYGKPSVVIISAAEYARLKEVDQRGMRLDEMSDSEIEEMLNTRIPSEDRYSISDIETDG